MPQTSPGVWEFHLGYRTPPLSMNDRNDHPQQRARKTAEVRNDLAGALTLQRIGPLNAIRVELHYLPARAGARDPINLCATLKVLQDACTPARVVIAKTGPRAGRPITYPGVGIVVDDTPAHVEHVMPVIHGKPAWPAHVGLWCRIVDLARHERITPAAPLAAAADGQAVLL